MLMDPSTMNVILMENVLARNTFKETNVTLLFLDGTNLSIPKVHITLILLISANSYLFFFYFRM